jgi:hypothetical protein
METTLKGFSNKENLKGLVYTNGKMESFIKDNSSKALEMATGKLRNKA